MSRKCSASQRTLFQTWGASGSERTFAFKNAPQPQKAGTNDKQCNKSVNWSLVWDEVGQEVTTDLSKNTPDEQHDLDDELMLKAADETEKSLENSTESTDTLSMNSTENHLVLPGYDSSSGKVWIFPTNFPVRDFQLKISEAALFQNTLVCLPTGLGKTFIASVVMYNFYRWYPFGKIVFMAPTKPLVTQQIEACYKVMGIPQQHMAELTGMQ